MDYDCVTYAGKVFIEIPEDTVDINEPYLICNKTYYQEATTYFRKLGIQCVDAFIYEGDITTLNIVVEGTVEVKSLYCIAENAKIYEYNDHELKIEIPI